MYKVLSALFIICILNSIRAQKNCDLNIPCEAVEDVELAAHYFETGWEGWIDGGSDCYRYNGQFSWEGNYSIRLRDNLGTASAMTSSEYPLADYNGVMVEFYFYPYGMESGDDFWLSYHDGAEWQIVASYESGVDFENDNYYSISAILNAEKYNLVDEGRFRFQCDATTNADKVYIDAVIITGLNSKPDEALNAITRQHSLYLSKAKEDAEELTISPNPVLTDLHISAEEDISSVTIFTVNGQFVKQYYNVKARQNNIDISTLDSGIYMMKIESEEEIYIQKFVKQK